MTSQPTPDRTAQLLERWHAGDEAAFAELLAETEPWLRAAVRSNLSGPTRLAGDTADWSQIVIQKFLRGAPKTVFPSRGAFRAYMKKVLMNALRDEAGKLRRRDHARGTSAASSYGDSVIDLRADKTEFQPSKVSTREEDRAWMRLAMELLDDSERQLLYAREVDERDWGDIAQELGYESADAARMACNRMLPKVAKLVFKLRQGRFRDLLPEDGRA